MSKPRLLVFASGTSTGGGSGFEKLVSATQNGILDAEIIGVVSNHRNGGVEQKAERLNIRFQYFPGPWTAERYRHIIGIFSPDFVALSGWLKMVYGLDPKTTFNIHPGPLPDFGGQGMYGHHVHEAVLKTYKAGKIKYSAVSMHFVTQEYDKGPVFFWFPIPILDSDTADDIGSRVNHAEHYWQPRITNLVVRGEIYWDGRDPASLKTPWS
jgi:folate-dependent phosphoribosylglycinamide formyltransferase PurN